MSNISGYGGYSYNNFNYASNGASGTSGSSGTSGGSGIASLSARELQEKLSKSEITKEQLNEWLTAHQEVKVLSKVETETTLTYTISYNGKTETINLAKGDGKTSGRNTVTYIAQAPVASSSGAEDSSFKHIDHIGPTSGASGASGAREALINEINSIIDDYNDTMDVLEALANEIEELSKESAKLWNKYTSYSNPNSWGAIRVKKQFDELSEQQGKLSAEQTTQYKKSWSLSDAISDKMKQLDK